MNARTSWLVAACVAWPLACAPRAPEAAEREASTPTSAQPALPNQRIEIPTTVRRNLGISFAKVEARRVAQTIRVPGAFELEPRARREYRMALPGQVVLLVDQHDLVEPGRPLFRFQSPAWPELQHEILAADQAIDSALAEIEVAKARLEEARRKVELVRARIESLIQADFQRADLASEAAGLEASLPRLEAELRLVESRVASGERLREHALQRAASVAGLAAAELEQESLVGDRQVPAYLTLEWIEVHALERGVVETLAVSDGAFVEASDPVLATVDLARIRFRGLALQGDLPRLLDAAAARIVPPRSPGLGVDEALEATLKIGLEAHPQERTVTLYAAPQRLAPWARPGVSAFLEVVVASSEAAALAIPRSAVVQDGLTHVFFRRDPKNPGVALRVEADMGVSDGRWVVLHSGVMRGDEVVLDGVYELKLATQQGIGQEGGHFHADGSFHDE